VTDSPDISYLDATELASRIRSGELSSVEIVQHHLERIARINPQINAVVTLADDAVDRARAADAAITRREQVGPLHGVPITVKDSLDTAGIRTARGSRLFAGHIPSCDATAVARLKAAGAIVLGKTNLPELAHSFESDNLVYGRCNNPYDLARTPGGSSGGEAAIIAAGGSPLGLGSDAGGSIRVPAHFCGVAGLKPTSGRVPSTGHFPAAFGATAPLWQVGPLARRVEHQLRHLDEARIVEPAQILDIHVEPSKHGLQRRHELGAEIGQVLRPAGRHAAADHQLLVVVVEGNSK